MSQKRTQLEWIKHKLIDDGEVTRNWALQNFISRLGAIICILQKEGWKIEGEYIKTKHGRDYKYTLIEGKMKRVAYKNPTTGEVLAIRYEKI